MKRLKFVLSIITYYVAAIAPANAFFYVFRAVNGHSTWMSLLISCGLVVTTYVVLHKLNVRTDNILDKLTP